MSATPATEGSQVGRRPTMALAGILLADFVVALVMLVTDKNLQTDFGATAPYYLHWYGVLALGIATLSVALVVAVLELRAPRRRRTATIAGAGWSALSAIAMVGVLATYHQVGFSSVGQFSQYLFGVSAYPGSLSYIPWLYDLMLGLYVIAGILGVASLAPARTTVAIPTTG